MSEEDKSTLLEFWELEAEHVCDCIENVVYADLDSLY